MKKIKTYRMSISRTFPATHPRAGERTYFEGKIECGYEDYPLLCKCGWCGNYEDLMTKNLDNGYDAAGMPVYVSDDRCPRCHNYAHEYSDWPGGIHKIHTIRANYPLWKKRIDEVNAGEAELVLYEWTGKPYQSKTRELFRFGKDDGIGVQELDLRFIIYYETLAHNDGLSAQDFRDWFKGHDLSQPLAIIWFVNKRY